MKKIQALAKIFPPTDGRRMYNGFELRGWKNRRKSQILSAQSGDESLRVEFELYLGGLKSASLLSSVSISNNCVVKVIHSISVPTFYANIRTQPSQRPSKLGNKKLSLKIFSPFFVKWTLRFYANHCVLLKMELVEGFLNRISVKIVVAFPFCEMPYIYWRRW